MIEDARASPCVYLTTSAGGAFKPYTAAAAAPGLAATAAAAPRSSDAAAAGPIADAPAEDTRLPLLTNVLCYVALLGHTRDGARAFGASRDVWRNDVQLRWALVRARHGRHKETRLHFACRRGYLARVVELLEWRSDIEACDADDGTPLQSASLHGHLSVVRELLRRGARVDSASTRGNTALHAASASGCLSIVRELLDAGANIEARGGGIGCTPLYVAAYKNQVRVVRELLARGAAVDAKLQGDNVQTWTALTKASDLGHVDAMRLLLEHGAGVNAQCDSGFTPLMAACRKSQLGAVRILLDAGADVGLLSNEGRAALSYARAAAHGEGANGRELSAKVIEALEAAAAERTAPAEAAAEAAPAPALKVAAAAAPPVAAPAPMAAAPVPVAVGAPTQV